VRSVDAMWRGIDHVLAGPANRGEWFLTDAFQWMIEQGAKIRTAEVAGWYDCGTVATTLETNRKMLEKQLRDAELRGKPGRDPAARRRAASAKVVEPCYIEDGVTIERSTVGPYASIEAGTVVRDSVVENAIIGTSCHLERVRLDGAMLGDHVVAEGLAGSGSLGAYAEVRTGSRA
jgi:glucose-1-phosphate thymidylyltransferase